MARVLPFLLPVFLVGLFGCRGDSVPRHEDFRVGMARSIIVEQFGPPEHVQTFRKSNDAVWGPIEDFWTKVPFGSTVEIWSYRSGNRVMEGSPDRFPGKTELYFIDGSKTVQGIGFSMDGAVYEGNR